MLAPATWEAAMRAMVLAMLVGLAWSTVAGAANCRKGIPCGNSCIAANRTCHLNRSAPPPATPKMQPRGSIAAPAAVAAPAAAVVQALPGAPAMWAASEADRIYFAPGCAAAQDLTPANKRFFPDEATAIAAGFRRSSVEGC